MKVFYSWQSDLLNATNRSLIEDALKLAAKAISGDENIDIEPVIDRDTKGLSGSPSIDEAIFKKIAEADAYVADISIVNQEHLALAATLLDRASNQKLRPTPNPNVLLELGFAVRALGWDRIILVYNMATGDPKTDLPFDLRQKRRVEYTAAPDETDRATPRKKLSGILDDAIREIAGYIASHPSQPPDPSATETAINAIEEVAPARHVRIRNFWTWVMQELRLIEPDLRSNTPEGAFLDQQIVDLKKAVDDSGRISCDWGKVCKAIALANDENATETLTRLFIGILENYDTKPGHAGLVHNTWFDFWRFIGHEFLTVWIGCLLKENRWTLINKVLSTSFYWERYQERTCRGNVFFDRLSVFVYLFGEESKRNQRLSYHADVLAKRYGSEGISSCINLKEFIDADLFLFIAGELRVTQHSMGWLNWRPWSVLYMQHQPRFLIQASLKAHASSLIVALGTKDSAKVIEVVTVNVPKLQELWPRGHWWCPIEQETINRFNSID